MSNTMLLITYFSAPLATFNTSTASNKKEALVFGHLKSNNDRPNFIFFQGEDFDQQCAQAPNSR